MKYGTNITIVSKVKSRNEPPKTAYDIQHIMGRKGKENAKI